MTIENFRSKSAHVPVAREGFPYILASAFATLIFAILGWSFLALPLLVVTFFVAHFFRDPERVITADQLDVLSPADGNVIAVKRVESTPFFSGPCIEISVFMSIFDVHVNRIPCSGTIEAVKYSQGRFMAANFAAASIENERNSLWLRTHSGHDVVMTQVAGLIARRIVCWPSSGDVVVQGERFGLIRFGSRMDVYVPEGSEVLVTQGKHVYGGETVLCRLK